MLHCKLSIEVIDYRDDPLRMLELRGLVDIDNQQYGFRQILGKQFVIGNFDLVWTEVGKQLKAKISLSDEDKLNQWMRINLANEDKQ